jgi:D-alanyl-D-alanine carboxypeptidase
MLRDPARHKKLLLHAIVLLITVSLIALSVSACGTPSFDANTQSQLDGIIEKVMEANQLPGAVVGVWVPGQGTWVVAKGEADVETAKAMKTTDKFRIASITKTFTSNMVLQLADEGKLELDDRLDKYLPEIPFSGQITLRQLLNHTSGIIDDNDSVDDIVDADPLKKWEPMEVVESYTGGELGEEPGKQINYSNAGYIILGMVIEKVSGDTVENVLQEKIAKPLELENTYFPEGPDISGEYAHGYDGTEDVTHIDMSWDWTAGAMISTLDDLKIWAKAFAEGTLLSGEMYEEQLTFVDFPKGRGEIKYGLGTYYEFGFLGHDGADLGYQSDMMYLPEKEATIIILFNKLSEDLSDLNATEKAFVGIADIVLPGAIPEWYTEAFED